MLLVNSGRRRRWSSTRRPWPAAWRGFQFSDRPRGSCSSCFQSSQRPPETRTPRRPDQRSAAFEGTRPMKSTQPKSGRKPEVAKPRRAAFAFEVGVPDVDLTRRVIDVSLAEMVEVFDARIAAFLDGGQLAANEDDGAIDRAGAARFLKISLTQLDLLSRREQDPIPFPLCGDSRRFLRDELRAWLLRQG